MNPYYKAVIIATAGLTIKSVIVKILNIRARIASEAIQWPEDKEGLKFLFPMFRFLLLADVKILQDKESLTRILGADTNNTSNEPWFLLAAAAWGLATEGNPAPYAVNLIYAILAARCCHSLVFISSFQPLRTFTFLPGFVATLFIAGQTLGHALASK